MAWKRLKKTILAMLGVSFALWAVPRFAMTYILFGLLDVFRNERKNFELFDRYFFGNGFLATDVSVRRRGTS